ncbi:MAG: exodeoxyribonuclease VII small subunit [Clostridia bacterium]|nr:exodeoxyribonuclease VII small subunit [Clostridia bacterium]
MSNKKTFEDNLKELEEVVTKLETGNLGLDEAIEEFEKGMKLSKECTKKLDEAEKRINILVENENGDVIEEKFEVQ